jgi:formate hydrogenlyase subunit 3/multisubunit Na+/H+ antiporter MnhD subunit
MTGAHLFVPIVLPAAAGLLALLLAKKERLCAALALLATAAGLADAGLLFGKALNFAAPWGGLGFFEFSLRLDHFSGFVLLAAAGFGLLIALYSVAFMKGRSSAGQYWAYFLITLAFVNGAALADSLIVLLFFWEGLLLTLFGMIYVGHSGAWRTAMKAFVLTGVADLCMMAGVALTIYLAGGQMAMSKIQAHPLPTGGLASLAFILLMIGATAKAGAMPFHTWIPDAAIDAPLPFMALVPAALEKLAGIYFLARITLDLYVLKPGSRLSILLMALGCVTILLPVMMALVQKNYKRLLAFHAISQVGYMILGIGTAVPIGIVGGLFHMINHAMYKSCLFLTGGSVEKQAGTADLAQLGALRRQMPITFACFFVAAASICGVPPFNGFFSKELVYDGALKAGGAWSWGWVFYAAALAGSFFTAASFLKLGHAAYFDKPKQDKSAVREAPVSMLLPMLVIAGMCLLFGVWNQLPLQKLIQPILPAGMLKGEDFSGLIPHNWWLVAGTVAALLLALANHLWGARRAGSGLGAADHIHHAPGLAGIYDAAERRVFDPYEIGMKFADAVGWVTWQVDRAIDFLYDTVTVKLTAAFVFAVRVPHTGSHAMYLAWALVGLAAIVLLLMGAV